MGLRFPDRTGMEATCTRLSKTLSGANEVQVQMCPVNDRLDPGFSTSTELNRFSTSRRMPWYLYFSSQVSSTP